jgi:hypothetical protein
MRILHDHRYSKRRARLAQAIENPEFISIILNGSSINRPEMPLDFNLRMRMMPSNGAMGPPHKQGTCMSEAPDMLTGYTEDRLQ